MSASQTKTGGAGREQLKVHYVPVKELHPAPYNPRRWDAAATKKLRESLEKYGFVDPIIVNSAPTRRNVVIGGHFRLKVAKDLGIASVPVVYVHIPDIEKEKELNLRLNRNQGDWDMDLLKNFETDFLVEIGFNDDDLSDIWDEALETEDDEFEADATKAETKKPKTRPGDMFQLGPHRLICGDSLDPKVVARLVGKQRIDTIYCDPPYNISLDYNKGVGKAGAYGGKVNDSKTDTEFHDFLKRSMENALAVAKPDCHVFYYCDETYIGLLQGLYRETGLTNRRVCLWVKDNANATPHVAFNKVYEPCVYATRGKPYLSPAATTLNEIMNKEIGSGSRVSDDILDLMSIWLAKRIPGVEYEHPTEKPPTLHEKPLRRCTKPGDAVLDLFGGSGSTLIACEQMKRRAFLTEAEPIFCDLIIKRYETLTNSKAKRIN